MSVRQHEKLIAVLRSRFEESIDLHHGLSWEDIERRLEGARQKLKSLDQMERTGGEPGVIGQDGETGEYLFCDCSEESPKGRRSLCYDAEALDARKENKPAGSAIEMAAAMGIEILDEAGYRQLQKLGEFDLKTSSWVLTPPEVRELGGAIFCDRRYDRLFCYHNGAQSYYASRGFRGLLRV